MARRMGSWFGRRWRPRTAAQSLSSSRVRQVRIPLRMGMRRMMVSARSVIRRRPIIAMMPRVTIATMWGRTVPPVTPIRMGSRLPAGIVLPAIVLHWFMFVRSSVQVVIFHNHPIMSMGPSRHLTALSVMTHRTIKAARSIYLTSIRVRASPIQAPLRYSPSAQAATMQMASMGTQRPSRIM